MQLSDLDNIRPEISGEYAAYRRSHHTVLRQHYDEYEIQDLDDDVKQPRSLSEWLSRQPFYRVLGLVQRPLTVSDGFVVKNMPIYYLSSAHVKRCVGTFAGAGYKNIRTNIVFRGYEGCKGVIRVKDPNIKCLNRPITMRHHDTSLRVAVALDDVDDAVFNADVFAEIHFNKESVIMTYEDSDVNGQEIQVLEVKQI